VGEIELCIWGGGGKTGVSLALKIGRQKKKSTKFSTITEIGQGDPIAFVLSGRLLLWVKGGRWGVHKQKESGFVKHNPSKPLV